MELCFFWFIFLGFRVEGIKPYILQYSKIDDNSSVTALLTRAEANLGVPQDHKAILGTGKGHV